jgi:transposase
LKSTEYRFRLPVTQVRPSQQRTELNRLSKFQGPPQSIGHAVLRRNLRRKDLPTLFEKLPPVEVVLEARGGSHHWGRLLTTLGHRVRLIPAQHVKPFVKRGKNDRNDAEAIAAAAAAAQPSIGSVPVKSVEAQARAMLLTVREVLVRQHTQLNNALCGHASEFGLVAPPGDKALATLQTEIATIAEDVMPTEAKQALALLVREIDRIEARLAEINATLKVSVSASGSRRASGALCGSSRAAVQAAMRAASMTSFLARRRCSLA